MTDGTAAAAPGADPIVSVAPAPAEAAGDETLRRRGRAGPRAPVAALLLLAPLVVFGLVGVTLVPHDPGAIRPAAALAPPAFAGGSWQYPLGTDHTGRDILSRLIDGARNSLLVALFGVGLAGVFGTAIGMTAGYLRGLADEVLMRLVDVQLALPPILLAVLLAGAIGGGLTTVIVTLMLTFWPTYARLVDHPNVIAVLQRLIGRDIRFDVAKLNMKAAGYGAAVEWHQDWAFYPHTNDDLCAVGFMMDDCEMENGPLMAIPGSHKGPILDHHYGGEFCGAIDPDSAGIDFSAAEPMTGPAGSITIHHARTIHGSAPNKSAKMRRLLLHQYRAADAWPLLGFPGTWNEYNALLVTGEPSLEPRLEPVPVRLPLPPASHQGSIYENQKSLGRRFFKDEVELAQTS